MSRKKKIEIDFGSYGDTDHYCESCKDYHGTFSVFVGHDLVLRDDGHIPGKFSWSSVLFSIFESLKLRPTPDMFKEEHDFTASRTICSTTFPDGHKIEARLEASSSEPSDSGLAYLRQVLNYAGFEPEIFVDGEEHIWK